MDLKADINWIKSEIDKVKDPDLIEGLKRILFYRNKNTEAIDENLQKVLIKRALIAEEQYASGKVHTTDQARKQLQQRFKP